MTEPNASSSSAFGENDPEPEPNRTLGTLVAMSHLMLWMESNQFLRDRLAELNAQIPLLAAEREFVQKKLQSVTYPVLSLPVEVTSEIFIHCLPDFEHADLIFSRYSERLPTPVLLSQICQTWRDIALTTPKIWAVFQIHVEVWPNDFALGAHRLAEWLKRAGVSPLSFVFSDPESLYRGSAFGLPSTLRATLAPILALSKQWRNAVLCLSHQALITQQFQSSLHERLPNLETLHITSDVNPSNANAVVTAFELAPSLRRVVLEGLPPAMILLPWKQLTHFSGRPLGEMDCFHILQLAVLLVECKFILIGGHQSEFMHETALLLPHPTVGGLAAVRFQRIDVLSGSSPASSAGGLKSHVAYF
ncbi:hypothetical protein B0H12DRAFT_1079477 [Mycena haematopus]|nr:hypothetical protein B0H12DRAFT_1079477 [Mycena haematopus]